MTDIQARSGSVPQGNSSTYYPLAGSTFPVGTPLIQVVGVDGTVNPGDASSAETSQVVGVASGAGVEGHGVPVQYAGPMTLTVDQWHAVLDTFHHPQGGLESGLTYYLSNNTGKISTTQQAISVQIGVALSETEMLVQIGPPIVL
jgi:hypothetical protein